MAPLHHPPQLLPHAQAVLEVIQSLTGPPTAAQHRVRHLTRLMTSMALGSPVVTRSMTLALITEAGSWYLRVVVVVDAVEPCGEGPLLARLHLLGRHACTLRTSSSDTVAQGWQCILAAEHR